MRELDGLPGRSRSPPTVTARRVELSYETPVEDILVINQNWGPGWRATNLQGVEAFRHVDGRIAVKVPAGSSTKLPVYGGFPLNHSDRFTTPSLVQSRTESIGLDASEYFISLL